MSRKVLATVLAVILVIISIVLSVMIFNGQTNEQEEGNKPKVTKTPEGEANPGEPNVEKETAPPKESKAPEKTKAPNKTKEPQKTESPKKTKAPEGDANPDGDVAVKESEAVSDDYFKGALFIGDSRIEGFSMLSGIKNAKFYADKGLNIGHMDNKEFVKIDGEKYTVYQALEKEQYDKIYIKLGVNELGWMYYTKYITHYENLIDQIKKTQPEAKIYVMEVIQVTKAKSDSNDVYTKANIDKMNSMLVDMVTKKEVNYLRINEVLTDEDGYLYADAANDGVHLKQEYCKKWLEYIKCHTVS